MKKLIDELNAIGLTSFAEKYSLNVAKHPERNLFILNYDQINSPRHNEIADYCRALVVEYKLYSCNCDDQCCEYYDEYNVVARSFKRFYNYLEKPGNLSLEDYHKPFEKPFSVNRKEDGSIIMIYFYDGEWFVNTRSSFGDAEISPNNKINGANHNVKTYKEAVSQLIDFNLLDKSICYVCEFCGPTNKHIMTYEKDQVILLACYMGEKEVEINDELQKPFAKNQKFNFNSLEEILNYINSTKENVEEGVVVRFENGERMKFKTKDYFALHKVRNNGFIDNEYIIYKVLSNEMFELRSVFPEFTEKFDKIENQVKLIIEQSNEIMNKYKDLDQKQFALKVKDYKFSAVLFSLRRNPALFSENLDQISKLLEKILRGVQ